MVGVTTAVLKGHSIGRLRTTALDGCGSGQGPLVCSKTFSNRQEAGVTWAVHSVPRMANLLSCASLNKWDTLSLL